MEFLWLSLWPVATAPGSDTLTTGSSILLVHAKCQQIDSQINPYSISCKQPIAVSHIVYYVRSLCLHLCDKALKSLSSKLR